MCLYEARHTVASYLALVCFIQAYKRRSKRQRRHYVQLYCFCLLTSCLLASHAITFLHTCVAASYHRQMCKHLLPTSWCFLSLLHLIIITRAFISNWTESQGWTDSLNVQLFCLTWRNVYLPHCSPTYYKAVPKVFWWRALLQQCPRSVVHCARCKYVWRKGIFVFIRPREWKRCLVIRIMALTSCGV